MPPRDTVPAASAPVVERSDWLELTALRSADQNSAIADLARAVRRAGSTDAVAGAGDMDRGDEASQRVAEDAFAELADRERACAGGYPFILGARSLEATQTAIEQPYTFCLLLTRYGKDAGPKRLRGERLFEDVSEVVARDYFGGDGNGARTYMFGFPRRRTLAGFAPAIDDLCGQLGEGRGARDRPRRRYQKDAGLDLVAWVPFPDRRSGKTVAFGQCATGDDWSDKLSELQPTSFCRKWIVDPLVYDPLRVFFVPHRIDALEWDERAIDGGIVFDRCRISSHASALPEALRADCTRWSRYVLRAAGAL